MDYIETTFNRIPEFHQSKECCDYFILRETAAHLSYDKIDEMFRLYNTYYD
jgi:hypothetical protein